MNRRPSPLPTSPYKNRSFLRRATRRALLLSLALVSFSQYVSAAEDDVLAGASNLGNNTAGTTYTAVAGTTSDVTFAAATTYANANPGAFTLTPALSIGSLDDLNATGITINGSALLTLNNTNTNTVASGNGGANVDSLFVASGGSLTINNTGGISVVNTSSFDAIGTLNLGTTGISITAGKTLSFTGAGTTTVNGVIANTSGLVAVNKAGGIVTFGGANLYTGGTTVTAGTLQLSGTGTLGSVNGGLTVNGGVLDLNGTSQGVGNFTGTGGSIYNLSGAGTSTLTIGNNNANGGIFAGLIADNNGTATGGKVAVTKVGTGTIQLSGANTYTGGTTISAGGLYAQNGAATNVDLALGTGAVNLNGGTLFLKGNGSGSTQTIITGDGTTGNNVTVGGNATIDVNQSAVAGANSGNTFVLNNLSIGANTLNVLGGNGYALRFAGTTTLTGNATFNPTTSVLTLAGNVGDGGSGFGLTKTGGAVLTLSGTNSYSGTTTISAGTLKFAGGSALPSGSAVSLGSATLQVANDGAGSNGTISLGNNVTINGATTTDTINVGNNGSGNTGNTVAFGALSNGTAAQANSVTINFTGANGYLESFSGLALAGAGGNTTVLNPTSTSVTITGNVTNQETFVAGTHFDTLQLGGTSTGNLISGIISDSGVYAGVNSGDTRVTMTGTGSWTLAGANTYHGSTNISAGTLNLTGSLANTSTVTTSGTGAFTESSAGVIGGTATFTQGSTGVSTLAGTNTYTGLTTVSAGTLNVTGSGTLGNGAALTVSGGTLDLGTTSQTVGAVNFTGASTVQNGSLTGTSYAASNTTGNVAVSANLLGSGALTKSGAGTLTLSGTNTYSGGTAVNAGILDFQNTAAKPASGFTTVANGATLGLGVGGAGYFSAADVNAYLTNTLSGVRASSNIGIDTTAGDFNLGGLTLPTTFRSIAKLGPNTLNLGTITRTTTGTLNLSTANGAVTTTNSNDASGILGTWATIGTGTALSYAVSNGGSSPITAYASGTPLTTAGGGTATTNFTIGASSVQTASTTGNTLQLLNTATSAVTISLSTGNNLTLNGILNSGGGGSSLTVSGAGTLFIGANSELDIISNAQATIINSVIANNGSTASSLVYSSLNGSTLTLGGANTYTGKTVLSNGTISISSEGNLGATPASAVADQLTLDNGTLLATGSGNQITLSANRGITLGSGGGTLNPGSNNASYTVNGIIAGSGTLTINGSNASGRFFNVNGANTYTGGTNILNSTVLNLSTATALGIGGTATFGSSGSNLQPKTSIGNVNIANPIALTPGGGRLFVSNGATSTLSGPITFIGGTTNPTFNVGVGGNNQVFNITGGVTGPGNISLGSGSAAATGTQINLTTAAVNNTGTITNAGGPTSGTFTISSVIGSNVTGLIQNASAIPLVLSGDNSGANFFGDTTLTSGTINLQNANALANSVVNTNATAGTLTFGSGATNITAAQIGGLNGAGSATVGFGNINLVNSGTGAGPVALSIGNSNAANGSVANPNTLNPTYSGIISGAGSITKTGTNTQTLTGANTYTGATTVTGGTLATGAAGTISGATITAGTLKGTTALVVNTSGTLLLGASNSVNPAATASLGSTASATAALSIANGVLQGQGAALTATTGSSPTYTGTVTGTSVAGLGALTLTSSTTLAFATGGTTADSGTLVFASFAPGGFTLNVTGDNFASASGAGTSADGTTERLIFATDQIGNLGNFSFNGTAGAAEISLDSGFFEIVPAAVPEPATYLGGFLLVVGAAWRLRRRSLRVQG